LRHSARDHDRLDQGSSARAVCRARPCGDGIRRAPYLRVVAGLVPAIHVLAPTRKTWMPGTSSAKTRFALLPGHDDAYMRLARPALLGLQAQPHAAQRQRAADQMNHGRRLAEK